MSLVSNFSDAEVFGVRCRKYDRGTMDVIFPFRYSGGSGKINKVKNDELRAAAAGISGNLTMSAGKIYAVLYHRRDGAAEPEMKMKISSNSTYNETYFNVGQDKDSKVLLDKFLYSIMSARTQFRGKLTNYWNIGGRDADYLKRVSRLTPLRDGELML